jgi:hypothetical protein
MTEGEKRMLFVALTESELIDRGELLSEACKSYEHVDAQRKEAVDEYKERLDELKRERLRLAHIVKTKQEPRLVLVRWIYDYEHAVKRAVRQDTGEVVEEKTIPKDELQTWLAFQQEKENGAQKELGLQ